MGEIIGEKQPIALSLGLMAVVVVLVIGIPLGTLAPINHNRLIDNLVMAFAVLYAVFLVVMNILIDVVYMWLDPRIRF